MRRARWAAVGAAAVALLLLAGCAEIPSSGGVRPGATALPNDPNIVFVPNPPAPGAAPRDIVTGFLTAASAGGDFDVARQYLASAFSAKWRPRERVLVQDGQTTISSTDQQNLTVEVPTSGSVNERGYYTASTRPRPLAFHLVQEGGQWRIDMAPNGIVLGKTVFQSLYAPRALQFFDPTWKRLVPDQRWFPTNPSKESVVQALIDGPEGPVAGGVTVNALDGAELGGVLGGGVTTVVLTTGGRAVSAEAADRMQQQLVPSLGLPTASALRLIVNGTSVPQVKQLADPPTSLNPYVVAGGRFGTLTAAGTFTEEPTLGPRIAALGPRDVTVSLLQRMAAVWTAARTVAVVTATGEPRIVDRRPGLIAPTLDQRGWTYSVTSAPQSALRASPAKGDPIDLVGNFDGASVTAIEVSPDGTRMLVLAETASGVSEASVAGIERNAEGTPIGLTTSRYPVAIGSSGSGVDATWVDDTSVAVLSNADNATQRVRVQQLGAGDLPLGELANATSIVGTPNQSYLRVRLQKGDIWTSTNNLWQSEGLRPVEVSVLAVQR